MRGTSTDHLTIRLPVPHIYCTCCRRPPPNVVHQQHVPVETVRPIHCGLQHGQLHVWNTFHPGNRVQEPYKVNSLSALPQSLECWPWPFRSQTRGPGPPTGPPNSNISTQPTYTNNTNTNTNCNNTSGLPELCPAFPQRPPRFTRDPYTHTKFHRHSVRLSSSGRLPRGPSGWPTAFIQCSDFKFECVVRYLESEGGAHRSLLSIGWCHTRLAISE